MTAHLPTDSDGIFDYLLAFVNVEKGQKTEFKLDRMHELAAKLGDPQASYASVHVAGSKGKGSVSAMIARILEAAGHRTGLYTSPHLLRWKERISLAGEEIPEATLLEAFARIRSLVEGRGPADFAGGELPTYFELTTLLGFEAFRLEKCDRAVIETGLGGRLDSTNIVESSVSVITPLELEHTEWLGDSIGKIAFEKAGIIKSGKPVCVSRQCPEAYSIIETVALDRGSTLLYQPERVSIGRVDVLRSGTHAELEFTAGLPWKGRYIFGVPLIGEIQAENMALALLAASCVEADLTPDAAAQGLSRASLPARFEILPGDPPVVIDGAHTPTSVALSLASFERLFPGPALLLFACASDKKHAEMAEILAPHFEAITITTPGTFKQSDPEAVFASFKGKSREVRLECDTRAAFANLRDRAQREGRPLLVTGSFYLCSEVAASVLDASSSR